MNIEQMKCPVCNNNIVFEFITPVKEFYIDNGEIKRDYSNIGLNENEPHLYFHCEIDKDHNIDNIDKIEEWIDKVENEFIDNLCLDL